MKTKVGIKHDSVPYAKVRIRNLEARIAECEHMDPNSSWGGGRTVKQRLKLDRAVLTTWQARLAAMEKEGR